MNKPVVGKLAKCMRAIPVKRPQDYAFGGTGKILCRGEGDLIGGIETVFLKEVQPGDSLRLPVHFT